MKLQVNLKFPLSLHKIAFILRNLNYNIDPQFRRMDTMVFNLQFYCITILM